MKIAAVIPARYQSSRFPGKPLIKIAGMTMIERVYRQVAKAGSFADIIVATDDRRIMDEVSRFGGKAEMTDNRIKNGSERVWSVVEKKDYAAVVNIQGDEPLVPERLLLDVCRAMRENPVVSAARRNDSFADFCSPDVVKVVCDQTGRALYFSRSPIPYVGKSNFVGFFQHIGIYGYTKELLRVFVSSGPTELEMSESLEQLRFLFLGQGIQIIQTDYVSHAVDIPADVVKIEKLLRG